MSALDRVLSPDSVAQLIEIEVVIAIPSSVDEWIQVGPALLSSGEVLSAFVGTERLPGSEPSDACRYA